MNRESDIIIIEKVLAGDVQVYSGLVDKYRDMVFTLAAGLLQDREEAEDLAQDVFVKAFKRLGSFRKESGFSTWLYRIAYNECISNLRKKKYDKVSIEEERFNFIEEEEPDREERSRLLHAALAKLPVEERAIIMLFYFEGAGTEEIAEVTSLSVSNVKTKLFRIRKKLYEELEGSMAEAG